MKKVVLVLFFSVFEIFGQCNDEEVYLWSSCYNINTTYDLNLSGQGLIDSIPVEIGQLTNLMYLDL